MAVDISRNYTYLSKSTIAGQTYSFQECKIQLMFDFPKLYSFNVHEILVFHCGQYTKAYKSMTYIMNEFLKKYPDFAFKNAQRSYNVCVTLTNDDGASLSFNIKSMASSRPCVRRTSVPLLLKHEIEFVKQELKDHNESDRRLALNLLEEDYQEMGQLIECACCFGNCVFDNMAQCMEGHLVCVECLNSFTEETVYGAGKIALGCMTSDCTATYPQGELKRCLSTKTWKILEERALNENLNMAKVEDLVKPSCIVCAIGSLGKNKCPHCDFAAILSPRNKVFHCYRENCQKETCRDCGTDWVQHEGMQCSEIETVDETTLRKKLEDDLCKSTHMCRLQCSVHKGQWLQQNNMSLWNEHVLYMQKPKIDYNHFCKHPLDPGKRCHICTACSIWTNPEADDEKAIQEISKEAQIKLKELGLQDGKLIGPPPTSKGIKSRTKNPIINHVQQ